MSNKIKIEDLISDENSILMPKNIKTIKDFIELYNQNKENYMFLLIANEIIENHSS